jgi:hypothetical protein
MKRSLLIPFPSILLIALLSAQATLATSVTPIKYGKWRQNQLVPFMWKADARPPAWLRPAILDAAADSGSSRRSQAAVFDLDDSATSWIGYTNDVCTAGAIGCAMNNAPNSFTLRIRPQGWVFDWGTLRWCQFYDTDPDGCFDAELVTLHELGHVQSLGHIEDAADPGDWLDSIMHQVTRAKPKTGWNTHAFGRCDVAALQVAYQPLTPSTDISTCLSLRTAATVSGSASSVVYRGNVKFTATLATADDVTYSKLRGLPLSQRAVTLERRLPGGSWYAYGQMPATTTDGQYALTISITNTYDWRMTFAAPGDEGLLGSTSAYVRVTVGECTSGCPLSAGPGVDGAQLGGGE